MKQTGLTAAILLAHLFTFAQDTHYETYQFGTRTALLGGAVVGGTRDNAMLIYNPAAIAFIDSSSFSLNANLYQAENTHIKNVLTQTGSFNSLQLTSVPLLTASQYKTKIPNLRVSYGTFSPQAFQFRGQARIQGSYPIVSGSASPGNETFVGDENLFARLRELNFALAVSYKLNDRWAIGLTNIIDVRSHYYNRSVFSYYYLNDSSQTLVSTSLTQSFNYYNVRYMPKLGLLFQGNKWSWGVTVTTPSIRVLGTGALGVDVEAINAKTTNGDRNTVVVNGRQSGVKSYFKSPFSVASGFRFEVCKGQLFISATYFGKEGVYSVLRATEPPLVRPASALGLVNGDELMQVITAARPVLNISLGWEQPLNERLVLDAGLRNNPSYYDPQLLNESGIKPDITIWNLYHAVVGLTQRHERSSLSLGLAYGFGRDKTRSDQYLPLPSETNFLKGTITTTQASYNSLGLVLGYNYFFRKG